MRFSNAHEIKGTMMWAVVGSEDYLERNAVTVAAHSSSLYNQLLGGRPRQGD
jgi:hypothetical protein